MKVGFGISLILMLILGAAFWFGGGINSLTDTYTAKGVVSAGELSYLMNLECVETINVKSAGLDFQYSAQIGNECLPSEIPGLHSTSSFAWAGYLLSGVFGVFILASIVGLLWPEKEGR